MEHKTIAAALISTDPELRTGLREGLPSTGGRLTLALEVNRSYQELGPDVMAEIQQSRASVFFLDFQEDAPTAIRFAQYLTDLLPGAKLVAVGGDLPHSLLLEAMRAGVSEYLEKPLSREALSACIDRLVRRVGATAEGQAHLPNEEGRVLAVLGAKGGAGATTLAVNLAISLRQQTGKSVVLVDLDVEMGEIAIFLGLQPRYDMGDLAKNLHRMDEDLLSTYLETHGTGMRVLPAPLRPNPAETLTPELVKKSIQFLKSRFDFVVVDLSRSFSLLTQVVVERADETYLLTQADLPSLRNIKRAMPLLERALGPEHDRVRLVLNRDQTDSPISRTEVEQALSLRVAHTLANDYDALSRAVNTGQPVVLSAQDSALARNIRSMAADIAGIQDEPKAGSRGFLTWRRLFNRPLEAPVHG